jgi:predicted  nucleic acid-binding Zn-ribbon protein
MVLKQKNTTMIRDRDVRNAIETLMEEFEHKEDEVRSLESAESDLNEKIETLELKIESLEDKIKELEEALAEAYLTGEKLNE